MKTKYIIISLFAFLFYNCNINNEDDFLKNFKSQDKYEYLAIEQAKKEINNSDLFVLNKSEALNEFVFNYDKSYYYGYKVQLTQDTYLVSYGVRYIPKYGSTFKLINWLDSYLCIYENKKGVVSKIKTTSSDPIMSECQEKDGIYTIKSFIKVYKSDDTPENKKYFVKDSIVTKYKIENNRFVKIK